MTLSLTRLPFTLITDTGLGSTLASIPLPEAGAPFGQAALDCTINLSTGNLFLTDKAFHFQDLGDAIQFGMIFNSQGEPKWRLGVGREICATENPEQKIVQAADGRAVSYLLHADGRYYATEYVDSRASLTLHPDQTYTWFDPKTRAQETFMSTGQLSSHRDAFGNTIRYEYAHGMLSAIIAANGTRYEFKRSHHQLIIQLVSPLTPTPLHLHTYTFSGDQLVQSETPDGYQIEYHYQAEALKTIHQSDGSALYVSFADQQKIQTLQIGDDPKNTHTFSYEEGLTQVKAPNDTLRVLKEIKPGVKTFTHQQQEWHASYVTEFNSKTGEVSSWIENYDHSGMVNRIHPKMLNGQTLNAPHYPPTMKELLKDSQELNIQNRYRW